MSPEVVLICGSIDMARTISAAYDDTSVVVIMNGTHYNSAEGFRVSAKSYALSAQVVEDVKQELKLKFHPPVYHTPNNRNIFHLCLKPPVRMQRRNISHCDRRVNKRKSYLKQLKRRV